MRIAVYSGSFDPLHIGHQAVMEYLTREEAFDWVYLVVSPQNPLKEASKALSGKTRYEAAQEAVKRHPGLRVKVDGIELTMEPPHYTVLTLDALKKREPQNDFTLVMGADSLDCIRKWKDYTRILGEYGVAVYPRKGFDLRKIKEELLEEARMSPVPYTPVISIIDAQEVDVSSTQIRQGLSEGRDMSEYLM